MAGLLHLVPRISASGLAPTWWRMRAGWFFAVRIQRLITLIFRANVEKQGALTRPILVLMTSRPCRGTVAVEGTPASDEPVLLGGDERFRLHHGCEHRERPTESSLPHSSSCSS